MSGRRAAPGGPSYAWSRRSSTPERAAARPQPEVHAFGSPGEFGPSVLVADRANTAFPVRAPQAPTGSAPWADVKPASAPHPGTRREARERERQQQRAREGRRPQVETRGAGETAPRTSPRGVAVNTTRALVLAGLIAGGYTQVAGMGGSAQADDTEAADTQTALGALVVDPKYTEFDREPLVNENALLERSEKITVARARAAAIAAKKRAEAKARARAEAKARAEALARATREANRNPKDVARLMVAERGWSSEQFSCLDKLWTKESGWNYRATNPSSGAYGIPQSLPGSKMASAGSDWRTNAATQIEWGLDYIADRYGTPCNAWSHSVAHNWY